MKILLSFLILITFALLTGPVIAAESKPVNSQVTDSVTQFNAKVLGDAPAEAMGILYKPTSQFASNAVHNAMATMGGTKAMDIKGKGK